MRELLFEKLEKIEKENPDMDKRVIENLKTVLFHLESNLHWWHDFILSAIIGPCGNDVLDIHIPSEEPFNWEFLITVTKDEYVGLYIANSNNSPKTLLEATTTKEKLVELLHVGV